MTRKEAKRRAELYSALAEGKKIQFNQENGEWIDLTMELTEVLSESAFRYRIKPEPKYRPFKIKEECWDEMMKHQPFGWVKEISSEMPCLINAITNKNIVIMEDISSFKKALNIYEFKDGTPFGIKEESNEQ